MVGGVEKGVSTGGKKKRPAQTLAALDAIRNLKVQFLKSL